MDELVLGQCCRFYGKKSDRMYLDNVQFGRFGAR